jgi:hypothetical protein
MTDRRVSEVRWLGTNGQVDFLGPQAFTGALIRSITRLMTHGGMIITSGGYYALEEYARSFLDTGYLDLSFSGSPKSVLLIPEFVSYDLLPTLIFLMLRAFGTSMMALLADGT